MSELDFTLEVLHQADCGLLLDVNNVYVNAHNHGYNARDFIAALPSNRIVYGHIAGHYQNKVSGQPALIDTHGSAVCADVWQLLAFAYQQHGVFPTVLERDFNLPPLSELPLNWRLFSIVSNRRLVVAMPGKLRQWQQSNDAGSVVSPISVVTVPVG